ncbi:MAG: CHAT domain-containing protein, partial [Planctomycetes bacterium]|nr:CHAT domain-containing protein [Planctomycetota bacterium]
ELQGAAKELLELVRMAEALNFGSRSRKLKTLANLQQRLVLVWRQMRLYERAAQSQEKRIQYVQQIEAFPGRALAIDYKTLGTLYTEANLYEKSLKAYEKSLELLKKHGKQEDIARTLGELGKSFGYAARYEKSMQTFQKAVANYEQMGDTAGVAAQESQLGSLLLRHMNRPHEAQTHFERAKQAYEAVGEIARQAESIMDIALCRRRRGDFEGAAERFKKALSMVREEKSKRQKESDTKTSPDRTRILGRQESRALSELGNTSWLNGKYQKAFQQCYAAREIAQELNDAYRLNVVAQLLGLIHWELNNYKQAHEAITEAIKYAKRAGRPREVVTAYNNRGIIFRRQGEYEEALEAFEKAFKVDRRLRDKWGLGYDHRNIGITLHRLGRLEEAAGHLEKAVRLTAEIGDAINHAKAVYYLGDLQREQGKKSATKYLGMALEEARGVYLPQIEWRALRSLGSLRLEAGEQEKAVKFLKEAVDVVEKMRTGLKVQEFRSGFLQNKMDLYEEIVKILLDMGREQEAFAYSERSRSRHFVDILAGKSLELRTAQEKRLYDRQQELGKEIQVLARAARQATTDAEREEAAGLLEKRRSEFKENLVNIRSLNPQLASFVSVEVAEIEALQEVMSEEVLLLVYYLLDDEVVAWVIGRDRFNTRRIPVKRVDLEKQIRSYRVSVQERELLARVKDQSQRLYKKLISPVEEEIVGPNVLCVVPHGALHYVSFASLYNGKEFLVERCPVSYLPSASIFPHSIPAEVPHRVGPDMLKVLAVGDPEVGKPAYRLPFTRQEIKSLKRNFVEVTALRGEKATESWVTENISDFDVIHFGVHGYFNPLNPLFSALMLAPDAERKEDGELELHEVSGLTIEAQLVALSACQSAVGELKSADELVSLSRAFFYAGTNSILSTLWRVDDVSTSLLAKHFYRYYAGHALEKSAEEGTKAEALRYAQLQVMNDGRHYHPMYWAGMTLTGDYR